MAPRCTILSLAETQGTRQVTAPISFRTRASQLSRKVVAEVRSPKTSEQFRSVAVVSVDAVAVLQWMVFTCSRANQGGQRKCEIRSPNQSLLCWPYCRFLRL